jgi:hypothetical protein
MSDAGIDYASWQWQDKIAQPSLLENKSKASAQISSPSPFTSSDHNSWSAVHPTTPSLSSWSLQYPFAWMSQNEHDSLKDLNSLYMCEPPLDIAAITSASGFADLGLPSEASPAFSSSETSFHSDTEHHQPRKDIDPSIIVNGTKAL